MQNKAHCKVPIVRLPVIRGQSTKSRLPPLSRPNNPYSDISLEPDLGASRYPLYISDITFACFKDGIELRISDDVNLWSLLVMKSDEKSACVSLELFLARSQNQPSLFKPQYQLSFREYVLPIYAYYVEQLKHGNS